MIDSPFAPAPPVTTQRKLADNSIVKSPAMMNKLRKHGSGAFVGPLRPPRSPAPAAAHPVAISDERLEDYAGRLQLGSSEDLSYAEFSNLEECIQNNDFSFLNEQNFYEPTENHKKSASLAGFFQSEKKSSLATNVFRRRAKVSSIDVASVGNASDTAVSVNSSQYMSGRDIHEKAKLHFNAGKYLESLPLFESILSAQVRRFSPLHPSVGAAMHNVGVCRQRLGQHALAENLFDEAVQIRRQTLGRDHLDVAASLSKLATTQIALRKFDDAYDNIRSALAITRVNLGLEHKIVAQMLCHLACLFFESGEIMSAQATFEDALAIYRSVWPRESGETDRNACMMQLTDTLCNIGSIQNRRKRFAAAIVTFSEALDLQRGIVSHNDARIISTLDNLGYAYSKSKDYAGALSCYKKMLRAQISHHNCFTTECFETFRKEILMFEKLKRFSEAITDIKETLQIQKSFLPRDHEIISETKSILDNVQRKMRAREQS